jgi:dipeptidyl aminopeptidase/acylaminoacyl peptidase
MKTLKIPVFILTMLLFISCSSQKNEKVKSDFRGALTEQEMQQGILTPEILWKFGRLSGSKVSPDGARIVYSVGRYDYKTNKSKTDILVMDLATGSLTVLTNFEGANFNQRWHPQSGRIGYLSTESGSVQLWEINPDGSEKKQISRIDGGIASFEYAPSGEKVLYTKRVKLDSTPQEKHPDLPLIDVRIEDDLMYRHWNSWHDYSYSHIFVADYENGILGAGKDIMEGERYESPLPPFFSEAEIAWSPDGKMIAYTSKKMDKREFAISTDSDIYLYNLETGETRNLTEGMTGYDKYPAFSPDGKKMVWQSMETPGYEADKERLFMLDLETGEKTYLTEGWDQNASNFAWKDEVNVYFISGIHATYQVYSLNVNTREISQITSGAHNYSSIDLAGGVLIGEKTKHSLAAEVFRIDPESGTELQLTFTNQHIYDHIEMARTEERWIRTTDGKDMLVWVIYPPGFDPDKQYPALLYCGGGPQSAVSQFFSFRWNFQIMAAHDYVIVAPNRRGLPTFGQAWNAQISGDWGGQATTDLLTAIDALKKEPFIDENRLGAVGASYGGFSVFHIAGVHQKRFKAFIAHNGTFNLESMYGATEETFFVNHDMGGAYWEQPTPITYTKFSPHRLIQNWDTPILVVTGEHDYRVPYTEGLQAFNSARLRGVPARLLHFPGETHFVLKPQNSILWQREFFGWLDMWLKE